MEDFCKNCGRKLRTDEIAMNKKMISRELESFMCISCLAKEFKVKEDKLKEKIAYFKKIGCTLFFM